MYNAIARSDVWLLGAAWISLMSICATVQAQTIHSPNIIGFDKPSGVHINTAEGFNQNGLPGLIRGHLFGDGQMNLILDFKVTKSQPTGAGTTNWYGSIEMFFASEKYCADIIASGSLPQCVRIPHLGLTQVLDRRVKEGLETKIEGLSTKQDDVHTELKKVTADLSKLPDLVPNTVVTEFAARLAKIEHTLKEIAEQLAAVRRGS